MSTDASETVIAIYRVKQGQEEAFMDLLRRHHPTLVELGLATTDPPIVYQGAERDPDGGPMVFEIFDWVNAQAPAIAHESPEVGRVWEAMGLLCEERGGKPRFLFPHVERVDLSA